MTVEATIDRTAQRLLISQENLGDNDNLIVRVTGADLSMGNDIISIIKVRRGMAGANAITVHIGSGDGSNNFEPGITSPKELTARVYDQGTGAEITTGLTYTWRLNTVDGPIVTVTALTPDSSRTVDAGSIIEATGDIDSIIVDRDDIANGYVCIVNTLT